MPPAIKQGTGEQVLQVITVSDITSQITGNSIPLATSPFSSQVEGALYPREKGLKVVSAQSPNGMIHYCAVVGEEASDPKYPKIAPRTKVVLQGDSATDRRTAMMTLLEQTEKKVAKEILKK
ncbi:hypothetical protein D6C98_09618 [Aureobasidium pullulans]|uniref:Uncharacterized protein n=2 Tax=Aureobasidium pullulans TaxID=5580 RepID=A0A4S8X3P8_AURPU|nr:hypothetical protein D6D24_03766 [Aureobasidium pullulans]THW32631.1 hypothetical protein D6D21_10314 [Aureobasidium pullulans]THY07719.1 hypothetical protein D6D03_01502 [Aureobasidium pullulans]THY40487.1 hypothetical protein D6C98_09618 [Aureobasidium pullulans]THY74260.1 hypothetical protein D6C94_05047 [Aureobasidium pullulans]